MNVAISTSEVGESKIYDLPDLRDFDGVISMPATMSSDTTLKQLYHALEQIKGKPHVSIDVPQEQAVSIQFDDRISMELLTEHLIAHHGARKIAFVSGPQDSTVADARLEACRNTMERHGLRLEESMVFYGQWNRSGGYIAAETIIRRGGPLPDAIMCANDDMALSVIECLEAHGIRVPKDIAVTGFDALQEAVMRGLTTISRPIHESARKSIEILNAWIDGKEPQEMQVVLPTVLVSGSSCGCTQSLEHTNEKLRKLLSEK
ncbi:MAG: substrate-binding domain-containing protein [Clostridia bacterium]|nr:substrate-binding domain-containing protein [Clostridia bacterium]